MISSSDGVVLPALASQQPSSCGPNEAKSDVRPDVVRGMEEREEILSWDQRMSCNRM